jgi:uncharacterized protein
MDYLGRVHRQRLRLRKVQLDGISRVVLAFALTINKEFDRIAGSTVCMMRDQPMLFTSIRRNLKIAVAASLFAGTVLVPSLAYAATTTESGVRKYEAGDYEGAIRDWTAAATTNDPNALFNLGQAYRLGRGVKADPARAAQFYQRAAELGHLSATGNLGTIYYFADAPLRDRIKAIDYWSKAASLGDARSQYMLSVLHFNGDGVSRDLAKAYAYASLSAANGLAEGRETLTQISKYVSPDDISKGRAMTESLVRPAPVQVASVTPAELPKPSMARAAALKDKPGAAEQARAAKARAAETGREAATMQPAVAVDSAEADMTAASVLNDVQPAATAPAAEVQVAALDPVPVAAVPAPRVTPPAAWRVQFGAFSDGAAAERQWKMLQSKSGTVLAAVQPVYQKADGSPVTKLQAGAFAERSPADALCGQIKSSGGSCFVVKGQ